MSRVYKIHGSGPFAGITLYAQIKHLSLTCEGVVLEFDSIPMPKEIALSDYRKEFSTLEFRMFPHIDLVLGNAKFTSDWFTINPNDIPALWTAWAKWDSSIKMPGRISHSVEIC